MSQEITHYKTLKQLKARKEELQCQVNQSKMTIEKSWNDLFIKRKAGSKVEMASSIISKSIAVFDAFLLIKKIARQYGRLFHRR